jgi:branched-chain amino acid transport system substrate-binding protein
MYTARGARHLTVIYDTNNRAYTEPLLQSIQDRFADLGGSIARVFPFASGETDLQSLMAEVTATDPETVVFIASGVDTALMIQHGAQHGLDAHLFSSAWAQTNELLEKGGQAVTGLEMIAGYHPQDPSLAFQQFSARFKARYGRTPGLMSSYAYEAVLVLAHALDQTKGNAAGLPEALASIQDWQGIQGHLSMDEYGDVKRDVYVAVVRDGQFEITDTISPADWTPRRE